MHEPEVKAYLSIMGVEIQEIAIQKSTSKFETLINLESSVKTLVFKKTRVYKDGFLFELWDIK